MAMLWRLCIKALDRAIWISLSEGSSTVLSVVYLTFGGILFGWLFTVAIEWWRGGRSAVALTKALSSWPPYVGGFCGAVVLWTALVLWNLPGVVTKAYRGHIRTIQSQAGDIAYLHRELASVKPVGTEPKVVVAPPGPSPRLEILINGSKADHQTVFMSKDGKLSLSIMVKNTGTAPTPPPDAYLYFSQPCPSAIPGVPPLQWRTMPSNEKAFPVEYFYGQMAVPSLSGQQPWPYPDFTCLYSPHYLGLPSPLKHPPVVGKLRIFYGSDKPAETNFVIREEQKWARPGNLWVTCGFQRWD